MIAGYKDGLFKELGLLDQRVFHVRPNENCDGIDSGLIYRPEGAVRFPGGAMLNFQSQEEDIKKKIELKRSLFDSRLVGLWCPEVACLGKIECMSTSTLFATPPISTFEGTPTKG
ncbi:hypothetical protein ACTXT7_010802 [Hymenolepis weldensis]